MAGARAERLGSIFKRIEGLYKGKGLTQEELPLWFDICKALPPLVDPVPTRPKPLAKVRKILYVEDFIKSDFLKRYKSSGPPHNLLNGKTSAGNTHIERYVKYFSEFALTHEELMADDIRAKVEEAMERDGIHLEVRSNITS